jgi:hypothetical protein
VRRADHLSSGVLPSVKRLSVVEDSHICGLGALVLSSHGEGGYTALLNELRTKKKMHFFLLFYLYSFISLPLQPPPPRVMRLDLGKVSVYKTRYTCSNCRLTTQSHLLHTHTHTHTHTYIYIYIYIYICVCLCVCVCVCVYFTV